MYEVWKRQQVHEDVRKMHQTSKIWEMEKTSKEEWKWHLFQ